MIDRLKEIIKIFFHTQVNFAEYLQVSKQQVSYYLSGKYSISIDNIIRLVNDYNINPLWLLTGQGNMLLSDDDKLNTSQQLLELQEENKKLQAQVEILKSLIQSKQ